MTIIVQLILSLNIYIRSSKTKPERIELNEPKDWLPSITSSTRWS